MTPTEKLHAKIRHQAQEIQRLLALQQRVERVAETERALKLAQDRITKLEAEKAVLHGQCTAMTEAFRQSIAETRKYRAKLRQALAAMEDAREMVK